MAWDPEWENPSATSPVALVAGVHVAADEFDLKGDDADSDGANASSSAKATSASAAVVVNAAAARGVRRSVKVRAAPAQRRSQVGFSGRARIACGVSSA